MYGCVRCVVCVFGTMLNDVNTNLGQYTNLDIGHKLARAWLCVCVCMSVGCTCRGTCFVK